MASITYPSTVLSESSNRVDRRVSISVGPDRFRLVLAVEGRSWLDESAIFFRWSDYPMVR